MPPSESRQITRPRPSLSCAICRRRKVRCGREQPTCNNCVKMNEACEYETDMSDRSAFQAKRNQPTTTAFETHANWTARDNSSSASTRQAHYSEASREPTDLSSDPSATTDNTPSSASTSSHHPSSNSSASLFPQRPQSQGLAQGFSNDQQSWNPAGRERQGNQQSGTSSSRKRPHTPVDYISPQPEHAPRSDSAMLDSSMPYPSTRGNNRATTYATPDGGDGQEEADGINEPGYLNVRGGGQIRYVGAAFWGLVKGHEQLCNELLGENNELPDNVPQPHIDSIGLATLLESLPNKGVCDIFLFSFLVGVRPIHPLIHTLTFRTDYNNFWQWRQNSDISLPNNKLLDDPTFLCLLFSVLYCGAATAPSSTWVAGVLQGIRRETMVEQLKTAFYTSLKLCQYLQHPTFNTLVSSLLAYSCSKQGSEPVDDLSFVEMVVRVAQSMGLHRDGALFGLDTVTCELRRRVWWHIVWLDVQASILNGSQTCYGGSETQSDVRMVAETRDEDISQSNRGFLTRTATLPSGASSVIMLFAIGRYETARFKHFLINRLHSAKGLARSEFEEFVTAAQKLHLRIDTLTARIPALGIPERGFIPSRLANASPLTHERLYGDHANQPTVFTSWIRIVLKMMKTEVAILLQKQFLGRADAGTKEGQRMWRNIVQLSLSYIRDSLQLARTPAFAPYTWFNSTHYGLLQCVFIILTYHIHNRDSENAHLTRYFVDEVIDIFAPDHQSMSAKGNLPPGPTTKPDSQTDRAWAMLVKLRGKLDSPSRVAEPVPFKACTPIRCVPLSPAPSLTSKNMDKPNNMAVTSSGSDWDHNIPATAPASPLFKISVPEDHERFEPNPDVGSRLDISDLDAWASSLTQHTNDYLWLDQETQGAASHLDLGVPPAQTKTPVSAPPVFNESVDYFDKWIHVEGVSRKNSKNGRGYRDESAGTNGNNSPGAEGLGAQNKTSASSNVAIAGLADRMMDDALWFD